VSSSGGAEPTARGPRRRGRLIAAAVGACAAVAIIVWIVLASSGTGGVSPSPTAAGGPSSSASSQASGASNVSGSKGPSSTPSTAAVSTPKGSNPATLPRPADNNPGPVILVPGYGGDAQMLAPLATALRKAGRTTVVLALPDHAMGDIRAQEQVLAAKVSAELASAHASSVDLVGYSAGGLVAGLFTIDHAAQVRRVVTLGSPLHGTNVAGLAANYAPSACPSACRQMVPGSALLAAFDAANPAARGVPWLSMWTAQDGVVEPVTSAQLPGAVNVKLQSVCPDDRSDHIQLPSDPLAIGLTVQALRGDTIASPSASDCAALRALG
jgi:triacylglycerol lipase